VNVLLDTHIALWAVEDNPRLSAKARDLITNPDTALAVSVVSLWEIAIKHALDRKGRDAMPMSAAQAHGFFLEAGYEVLPLRAAHVLGLETLPRHHDDPFDRLLAAIAMTEPLRLVTHDKQLASYSDLVMLV